MSTSLEEDVSALIDGHPRGGLPSQWLSLAQALNELLDEGASTVIDDAPQFCAAFHSEQMMARLLGPEEGLPLALCPDIDLSTVAPPTVINDRDLVFFVQRDESRLPLKVTVSLVAPHLPALYEPVSPTLRHD